MPEKKRKLPEWMTAAKSSTRVKRNLVWIPNGQYYVRTLNDARLAVDVLRLSREVRVILYGESAEEPFHFFENCGALSVLDVVDILEVVVVMKGREHVVNVFSQWDDAEKVADEIEFCLESFEAQFAPVVEYLSDSSKFLVFG